MLKFGYPFLKHTDGIIGHLTTPSAFKSRLSQLIVCTFTVRLVHWLGRGKYCSVDQTGDQKVGGGEGIHQHPPFLDARAAGMDVRNYFSSPTLSSLDVNACRHLTHIMAQAEVEKCWCTRG